MDDFVKVKHKYFLLNLFQKHEEMFDGTLGKYKGSDYTIEVKENAKFYYSKPFPIPNINKPTLNKEVDKHV